MNNDRLLVQDVEEPRAMVPWQVLIGVLLLLALSWVMVQDSYEGIMVVAGAIVIFIVYSLVTACRNLCKDHSSPPNPPA
jgi:predicted lysophospholipase L1 biosynthesis ABC-type transport system permease subunit